MSRRALVLLVLGALTVLGVLVPTGPPAFASQVGASGPADAPRTARARPNIVLLVADDWGFTDVGAFGGEIPTPRLDALAARGTRFTNFHVAASCAPTRAMLLTGVEHHRAGIGNLIESMPRAHMGRRGYLGSLDTNVVTVPTLLQEAGYRTYVSGKWNVGTEPHNLPPRRGFDRSIVQGDTGSDNWVPTQRYLPHSAAVQWFEDGRPAVMPERFYSSEWFVDRMIGYLESDAASDRPFFGLIGFQANHAPLQAPREFVVRQAGRYDAGWEALRRARRDRAATLGVIPPDVPMARMSTHRTWDALSETERRHQARSMEVYAAMAEAMDHHVGRLVDYLKARGQYEDTVFVFLSDNGPEGSDYATAQPWLWTQYSQSIDRLGAEGAYAIIGPGWASAAAAPLAGYKFVGGEGGTRVPLIVAGVPGAPAGALHHGLTHVTDLAPTLLELAGVAMPGPQRDGSPIEPISGRSLLPALREPTRAIRGPDDTLGYELSGDEALYRGDLKLARSLPPLGDGQWRLYDLRTDPGETADLAARMPEAFASMRVAYDAWAREHHVLPMPADFNAPRQVTINSLYNYWLPAYGGVALAVLLGLGLGTTAWIVQRRRRGRLASRTRGRP
ncbi:MAG: arylsulfatase [Burkholderiales bacterium]|nr:MAG: arylsulfatase [Burkholderiales bacterium]